MNEEIKIYAVYALVDPRDSLPHYIGQTADITERFRAHINLLKRKAHKNAKMQKWYNSLAKCGKEPTIQVLEYSPSTRLIRTKCELNWIRFGKASGWPLCNDLEKIADVIDGDNFQVIDCSQLPKPTILARILWRIIGRNIFTE